MRFIEQKLPGIFLVDSDIFPDDRGSFTCAWLSREFGAMGLSTQIAQCSIGSNRLRGTLRGLHMQVEPYAEHKTVRVTRGAVFDVAVDLRPDSPTYCQWVGVELSEANRRVLYIPPGFAHGYQTLSDNTDVLYFVSADYSPSHQRGFRYDDPAFGIQWPLGTPTVISARDAAYSALLLHS